MLHTEPAYVQTAKSAFNFLVFSIFLLVYITPNDPPESIWCLRGLMDKASAS